MSLQVKVVAFLLLIAMVPLAVAAVLIDQTAKVAYNFASNEAAFFRPPLAKAKSAYLELIATKRDLYYRQVAVHIAAMPEIFRLVPDPVPAGSPQGPQRGVKNGTKKPVQSDALLDSLLAKTPELQYIAIIAADGRAVVERRGVQPAGVKTPAWRPVAVDQPIADSGAILRLTFAADPELEDDYRALARALERAERIDQVRSALPSSYRIAFVALVGGVVILVSATGIAVARRFTRRIYALVSGTRQVAGGDLQSRVELKGRDELAELARAFNRMVHDLDHDRVQIAYLQRVSAWQDVARKLAHEIKNPLTPIQLAVQQCVSSYPGDDQRYRRLLGDTEEIVTEEISSLRRLVDAFRMLGQLPRVEARPLDLADVVDDLTRDPSLLEYLEIHAPPDRVMIRGDRMLLRRVLTNLVENGIQAGTDADRDGKVAVRWSARGDRVVLTVDDEGPGVAGAERDKIFEPYVTHKAQGTGLGLTISKKVILEHNGTLELSPDPAPEGGARFLVTLPLATEETAGTDVPWRERA
ncbi:MAG: ATP-binding protein [Proteobacteria bacterium]|nr:ATP-binding protein [Pseudomonadota bacterium]